MAGYVCPECGLDYDSVAPSDAAVAIRSFPGRYRERLRSVDDEQLRRRPEPGVWSAIEYAAHVGDLYPCFSEMVVTMRAQDRADLDDLFWDSDERAEKERYGEKDLNTVLADLDAASSTLAEALGDVAADEWERVARFSWGERDLLTMTRNAVHEGVHHLRDVERVLAATG